MVKASSKWRGIALALVAAAFTACSDGGNGGDLDAGTDTDADTDTDSDTDTDTDSDTDTDTDTDADFDYESPYCSGKGGSSAGGTKEVDPDQYAGLTCVGWEVGEGGALTLQYFRNITMCLTSWTASVSMPDPSTVHVIFIPDDSDADCYCCYDHLITVYGVDTSGEVELTVAGESLTVDPFVEPEGMRCRIEDPWEDYDEGFECPFGTLHDNCEPGVTDCGTGYSCEAYADAPSGGICMRTCSTEEDCLLDIFVCASDLCEIAEPLSGP